jgi:hypothetical protein
MTLNDIRAAAPAVFAEAPSDFLSSKYGFVNTAAALEVFANEGYVVVKAQQDNPRLRNKMHVRHALTLRHESAIDQKAVVGEYVPQMLLINSHNGRTVMSVRAGLYRYVCANGVVVGNDMLREQIRHTKALAGQIVERIRVAAALSVPLAKQIARWNEIELAEAQAQTFAQRAAALRFGKQAAGSYQPAALLESRRVEDEGRSLWKVFNRVQENVTNQQLEGLNANGRVVHSRLLTGIGENTKFNEALWQLAEEMA